MIQGNAFRIFAVGVVAAVLIMAESPSVHGDPSDSERVVGAIVGSVIGGAIGSTVGRGADRGIAIGVGSLLGGIAGYNAVNPDPYPYYRREHHHRRYRERVYQDNPVPRPRVHVYPRRDRHVHDHYYEAPPQPRTVVTYQPANPVAPVITPLREVNVVMAPPRGRSHRVLNTVLTECKVLEGGIAPVYACRTAVGNWRILE